MGRRKKQEEVAHCESWLVSYCDMISLLVTFFLMMMTFSTSAKNDVREVGLGLLKGNGGVWRNQISLPTENMVEPEVVASLAQQLRDVIEESGDGDEPLILPTLDGFTVTFDLDSSFDPGSAVVPPALRAHLITLTASLRVHTHLIVVQGFTDDAFQATSQYPNATALGLARARAAARVMLENSLLAPDQLQISSAGSDKPRATNATTMGRRANRRIEIRVLALAKPRSLSKQR